jgi:hypothetical protein
MINYDFYALHHYDINSGILLFSNVTIYEVRQDNGDWANHTFIRTLTEFTDFSSEDNSQPDFFTTLSEFFRENWPYITILGLIILGTGLSIRKIHRDNIKRGLEEYKRFQSNDKLQSTNIYKKKLKRK